jgi:hypothetical protein
MNKLSRCEHDENRRFFGSTLHGNITAAHHEGLRKAS